ncbi:hypothetical protein Tco_0829571 [Tanacetum coccineum]
MLLYIKRKENGKLLVDSVLNGPFDYGTVTEGVTETIPAIEKESKLYDEFDMFTSVPGETIHSYYLRQHEAHADEVRLTRQRFSNPIALKQVSPFPSYQLYDVPMVQQHPSQAPIANHFLLVHHQSYQSPDIHQPSQAPFPLMDSGLVVPSFLPSDDPIVNLNKAMAFISTTFTSRYPPTNNQLRTSSNPRNQETIQDRRVIV